MADPLHNYFDELGGEPAVRQLAERFYDLMDEREPSLAELHRRDEAGKISRDSRDRFALFLVGWLGGPQHYLERHGHPRLRMRHAPFPVDEAMKDAWLRCMNQAVTEQVPEGRLRDFLLGRFSEVAHFLRNREG